MTLFFKYKTVKILSVLFLISVSNLRAQEIVNNHQKVIIKQSITNITDYFGDLKSTKNISYQYNDIKIDTIINSGNKVIVKLTEQKYAWAQIGTNAKIYNSLLKDTVNGENSIYMLIKSTIRPEYAKQSILPPQLYDLRSYGDLKWEITLIQISEKETQADFSFASMEPKHKKSFLNVFSIKDNQYFTYNLKKIYITNKFSNLILQYIEEKAKTDFRDVPPMAIPPNAVPNR